jgi:predicted DNA-binding protein
LDPACFPQPIELELPDELMERLQRMAKETGFSLSELVHNLICQQLNEKAKEP